MKTIIMKIVMAKRRSPNGLFFFAKFTKPIMKTYRKGDKIIYECSYSNIGWRISLCDPEQGG